MSLWFTRLVRKLPTNPGLAYWVAVIGLMAWVLIQGSRQGQVTWAILGCLEILLAGIAGHLLVYLYPIEMGSDRNAALRLLSKLEEKDQLVLILRCFLGWRTDKIASEMGIDEREVKKRSKRALRKLAEQTRDSLSDR